MMRGLILGCILLGLALSMGCIDQIFPAEQQPEEPAPEIPNPAAENCIEKGYQYDIRTGPGGEYGVCTYYAQECEEWDLYRGDCCFRDSDCRCSAGETAECEDNECICIAPEPVDNETEPEAEPEQEPEPEPEIESSNKTVGGFLDYGLSNVNSEFYKEHPSGNFQIETYTWVIGSRDIKPNELPVGGTGDVAIRFNGDKDPNLKGFGFKSYTPMENGEPVEDSLVESWAVGVFSSQFPMIHIYETNGMTLKIDYYPTGKTLYGCVIYDKEEYLAEDDSHVMLYYFYCVDAGPLVTS